MTIVHAKNRAKGSSVIATEDPSGVIQRKIKKYYTSALFVSPRHGALYNAFGSIYEQQNITFAREIYDRGIAANCTDVIPVYHGYGQLELKAGNAQKAIDVMRQGLIECEKRVRNDDSSRLFHSLGMALLSNNEVEGAKVSWVFAALNAPHLNRPASKSPRI